MAQWFTVYCTRSVNHVTGDDILAWLTGARMDLHCMAEVFGIDDADVVNQAEAMLSMEPEIEIGEIKFLLRYRPPEFRPVLIHLWTQPERVQTEREEVLERLEDLRDNTVKRICSHLDQVVEVAALELGLFQLEDMGIVIASTVAQYLAIVGGGLIEDHNGDWWAIENDIPQLLLGPEHRG